jgi:hypothetical protein
MDLRARMGHDDMRAALIYQRATSKADQQIVDRLARLVDDHRDSTGGDEENDGGWSGRCASASRVIPRRSHAASSRSSRRRPSSGVDTV